MSRSSAAVLLAMPKFDEGKSRRSFNEDGSPANRAVGTSEMDGQGRRGD